MEENNNKSPGLDLGKELAIQLPSRRLMATISVLGLPLLGVSDVGVNVDTTGPGWLIGSVGSV